MDTINWGILGPGRIARSFAEGLAVTDGGRLHAVASRQLTRAATFIEEYQAEKAYGTYEELVNDPQVDAVYVATPHRFHYEQVKLALEAGKPVLCEKPMTVNALESEELVELARRKKVFLMEALWTRYLPIYQVVREWLDTGRIGELRLITSSMGFPFERDPANRWFNPDLAGGALLDLGVYNISCSQWAFQRDPESFHANVLVGQTGVDERTSGLLDFGDGALSQFTCTIESTARGDLNLNGTQGQIQIHPLYWCATKATLFPHEGEPETVERPLRASGFEYEIEAAMSAIRAGNIEEPTMPHAHTLSNMRLMDAIRASANFRYHFE